MTNVHAFILQLLAAGIVELTNAPPKDDEDTKTSDVRIHWKTRPGTEDEPPCFECANAGKWLGFNM